MRKEALFDGNRLKVSHSAFAVLIAEHDELRALSAFDAFDLLTAAGKDQAGNIFVPAPVDKGERCGDNEKHQRKARADAPGSSENRSKYWQPERSVSLRRAPGRSKA